MRRSDCLLNGLRRFGPPILALALGVQAFTSTAVALPAREPSRVKTGHGTPTMHAPSYDQRVQGHVSDANGPLAGATVAEKGSGRQTSTRKDGSYSLDVSGPNAVLVVSFVGYTSKEVPVAGRSTVDVTLEPTAAQLNSVVVTALGINRAKKSLGYSVAEVKAEDLVKAANQNVMKSLDGKVSGVNLVNVSPDPTSSVLVNIRGTTALPTLSDRNVALKSQPLYVIDGIPVGVQTLTNKDGVDFGNILSQINPEDVDNITILKGGSAGALYGAEGGNGVVMITTKSGRYGKKGIGVNYTTSYTVDQPFRFLKGQTIYGPGYRADSWAGDATDTWGPKLDGTTTADFWNVKTQQWDSKAMVSNGLDNMQQYLQNGATFSNSLSVNGNYDKGSFRFSLSDLNNKGVMPNTKTDQVTAVLAAEYKITNNIKLSVNTSYLHTFSPNKARSVGSGSVMNDLMYGFPNSLQPLSDMHNYWLTGFEGVNQNGAMMEDNRPGSSQYVSLDNPWWVTYERIHRFWRDNYFGKIQLDWRFSQHLSLMLRTGMENVKEYYEKRESWSDPDHHGSFVQGNNSALLMNTDALLNYSNTFGKFTLNATGGVNYAYANNNNLEMTAGRLSAPALFQLTNAAPGTLNTTSSGWSTTQGYSVYGIASLGWADQLYLDVTGRNDWKGVLPEEKISYFYPSASLSWIVNNSIKMPDYVNLFKIRAGWADVGNGLVRKRSVDTYSFDASDWGAAKTVNINATLVDKDIKPMHSITKEAGVDLNMFDNRFHFDFTYFIKDQKDQIDNIPTVPGTGYPGILTNIGDVRSKGFEIGIGGTPIRTKDFQWDISATYTHYKATITRLSSKFAPNGYVFADYGRNEKVKIAVGEEIGNIYEANPILKVKSGKYKGMYLLDNEYGEFQKSGAELDREMLGNFNPDGIFGFNTTFRYKQFSLNLVGSYRMGGRYVSVNQKYQESDGIAFTTLGSGPNNKLWSGGRDASQGGHQWPAAGSSQYDAINNNNDGQRSDAVQDASYAKGVFLRPDYTGDPDAATDADYIVNGADPNNTFYQLPTNSYGDCIWNFSSTRTYDATNFKLREISLAYTVPAKVLSRSKIYNLTFSLIGRNVLQWTKSGRNEDPESAFQGVGTDQGVLRAGLPSVRSFGFKLNIGL